MTLHCFTLIEEQTINELNITARLYRHNKTGAQILSVEANDENKCFGISFRTPAHDSSGLTHILEHLVLTGSRKYPLKDPFAELLKGSLQTFLNALTFPDKTCYPVASQNLQDFYNLVEVYLDTVFYPLLRPENFRQQAWHYQVTTPDSSLSYQGVVFNEMKGVYSSPDSLLGRYIQQSLFQGTEYSNDSGGDPLAIPSLTYDQLVHYHRAHYTPGNSLIYFYGDDDPERRLTLLDSWLGQFSPSAPASPVTLQPAFTAPLTWIRNYPSSADGLAMATTNWLLPERTGSDLDLALGILSHILIGTVASPLRKSLIDSGLGENFAGSGFGTSLRQMYFSVGLKGMQPGRVSELAPLVDATLEKLVTQGIDRATIEASINTVEFQLRENNTGSFPKGLALMFQALSLWLHGRSPLTELPFAARLERVKEAWHSDPRYFEALIESQLLNNKGRTHVWLLPDQGLSEQRLQEERTQLATIRSTLSSEQLQEVAAQAEALQRYQETPDAPDVVATIPTLKLGDIDRRNKIIPIVTCQSGATPTLFHNLPTSGIVYLDVGFNLADVPQRLVPYLPIFARALREVGTEKEDFVRLSQRIGRATGGITSQVLASLREGTTLPAAWLFVRGKATVANFSEMLSILLELCTALKLDNRERIQQIVLQEKAGMEAHLIPGGNGFVHSRLASRFSVADWTNEQIGGIDYLFFLRHLIPRISSEWQDVLADLKELRSALGGPALLNVTSDESSFQSLRHHLERFAASLPAPPSGNSPAWLPTLRRGNEGLVLPSAVNYVGKAANLHHLGFRRHGSALVATQLLNTSWIWDQIRVKGGAYGGGISLEYRSGNLAFLSYRDPNLQKTLAAYDGAAHFLRSRAWSEREVTRGIIGTIRGLDAYQLPDAKGYTSMVRHVLGITDDIRQTLREEVLDTTATQIQEFAAALEAVQHQGSIVVLGGKEALEPVKDSLNMEITKVL